MPEESKGGVGNENALLVEAKDEGEEQSGVMERYVEEESIIESNAEHSLENEKNKDRELVLTLRNELRKEIEMVLASQPDKSLNEVLEGFLKDMTELKKLPVLLSETDGLSPEDLKFVVNILKLPISSEVLGLLYTTARNLQLNHINYLGDLLLYTRDEVFGLNHVGNRAKADLDKCMKENFLEFNLPMSKELKKRYVLQRLAETPQYLENLRSEELRIDLLQLVPSY